ncbi:MAG: hypothetical protein PVI40_09425, partial [Chlamydiota bacterium]
YALEFTYKNWTEISDVKLKAQSKEKTALIKEKKRSLALLSEEVNNKREEVDSLELETRALFGVLADLNTMNAEEFVNGFPEEKRKELLISIAKNISRLPYFFDRSAIIDGQKYVNNNHPTAIELINLLRNNLREVAMGRVINIPIDRKIIELNKLSVKRDRLAREVNKLEA